MTNRYQGECSLEEQEKEAVPIQRIGGRRRLDIEWRSGLNDGNDNIRCFREVCRRGRQGESCRFGRRKFPRNYGQRCGFGIQEEGAS